MLDDYGAQVNDAFMDIYNSVRRVEEKMLHHSVLDLSISELDMLESVGKFGDDGCSISEIARDYDATLPTVTVAVKRLEAKGFVEKVRSSKDGRMVRVGLTRIGKKADAAHRYFHERMVRAFLKDIKPAEQAALLLALKNLGYFLQRMGEIQEAKA